MERLLFKEPLLVERIAARPVACGGIAYGRGVAHVPEEGVAECDDATRPKEGTTARILATEPAVSKVIDRRVGQTIFRLRSGVE